MSENNDELGIDMGDYVEYKVVTYKSAFGLISWFWMVIMAFVLLFSFGGILFTNDLPLKKTIAVIFTFSLLVVILTCRMFIKRMNYVRLSKDFLVVKNNILKKQESIYSNSYIREVILEKIGSGRGSRECITIITNDLDSYSYACELFYRRTFFDLKNAMIGYGINVTDKMNLAEKDFKTFIHK